MQHGLLHEDDASVDRSVQRVEMKEHSVIFLSATVSRCKMKSDISLIIEKKSILDCGFI